MKAALLLLTCIAWSVLGAQGEFQEISTGAGYNMQSYVHLGSGMSRQVANSAWDIAFSLAPQDAGVFINESVGSDPGVSAIRLFYTASQDFSEIPDSSLYQSLELFNSERSWTYGAFNEIRAPEDPYDVGWGEYDSQMDEIHGSHVFVIRLRDGTDLKMQIQSLASGTYQFRYANLDGSNEVTKTVTKADHSGLLAYFSFETGDIVDVEPATGFEMVFLRYTTPLPDPGGGDPIPYLVTGILSGGGVQVAQANGIDPETVSFLDFADSLSTDIEVIGHDWKSFNLNEFMWVIPDDLVYFLKTADDRVWKIQFVDFEGSTTGTAVLHKLDLGIISSVEDAYSPFAEFSAFPNPAEAVTHLVFTMKGNRNNPMRVQLLDLQGRTIRQFNYTPSGGLNAIEFTLHGITPGMYVIRLSQGDEALTTMLAISGSQE